MHGGGHAWWGVVCVVGGHAWQGGMRGMRGLCVADNAWQGGVCGRGGMHGRGGMRGRGACVAGGGVRGRYYEIRSMSGPYASYWNAFLYVGINSRNKLPVCMNIKNKQMSFFIVSLVLLRALYRSCS